MSKAVRVVNGVVREIIPSDASTPSIAYWYGDAFAAQCVIAPDDVQQGWTYNTETDVFSEPVQQEGEEPPIDPMITVQLAIAELAEAQATSDLQNQLAIAELAEAMLGGET